MSRGCSSIPGSESAHGRHTPALGPPTLHTLVIPILPARNKIASPVCSPARYQTASLMQNFTDPSKSFDDFPSILASMCCLVSTTRPRGFLASLCDTISATAEANAYRHSSHRFVIGSPCTEQGTFTRN